MSHFGDNEFLGSDPSHQGSEDKIMFRNGAPSDRGTVRNPIAEQRILEWQARNQGSDTSGAPVPPSRTSPPVSRPAATAKPPQMNFGDGDGDQEGDIDDGHHKAKRKAPPEIHDEDTRAMPPGYHNSFMEAPPDEAGSQTESAEPVEAPVTIRKERAPK